MPHRRAMVFTLGKRVQFEIFKRVKTRVQTEIVEIKTEGQHLACMLHEYEGRVSVVKANLQLPSLNDKDYSKMEMNLHEWEWVFKTLRKSIQDLIEMLEQCYEDLDLINHQLAVFG